MGMRYKPQARDIRYVGGVGKYDIYVTSGGNIIARFGDSGFDVIHLGSVPYRRGEAARRFEAYKWSRAGKEADVPPTIDALMLCFAHDLCDYSDT